MLSCKFYEIFKNNFLTKHLRATASESANTLTQHCTKNEAFHKDLFSKCDQIRSFLRIWSHLQKKYLTEDFIFCAMQRIATTEASVIKLKYLLPPIRAADIVECLCNYVDEISLNLQSMKPCTSTVFSFLRIMVKQEKSSSQTSQYQRVNHY